VNIKETEVNNIEQKADILLNKETALKETVKADFKSQDKETVKDDEIKHCN